MVLVVLCALVSCATVSSPKKAENSAAAPMPPAPAVTNPEISGGDAVAREHLQNAMNALQAGREANAKTELDAVLRHDPENKVARSLLAQIQTDPAKYFSAQDSFNYTLQPGDTLPGIAQRFLDEPLKFHILARFNGITDPSRLAPGRVIKVPGKKAGTIASAAAGDDSHRADSSPPRVESARGGSESRTQRARQFYDAGKYQQAIEALEGSGAANGEARELLALCYGKYAEELVQNRNLIDAQSVLENALSIQPGNDKLRKQLRQVQKQREVMRLYKAGTESMAAGDSDKALDAFNAVLKLDPTHEDAKKQVASISSDNVESMHKDALLEYNKQNLDKAIDLWDRVLALLPTHSSAKLYRARAIDLRSKLQKLDQH